MLFKERLIEQRINLGFTKKEIAEKINVDQSTYGKYELGQRQPSLEILQKLASFFEVSVDYLLGISDNPNPPNANKAPSGISTEEALWIAFKNIQGHDPTEDELKRYLEMSKIFFNIQD